jgi:predicted nucleic acid-binding protein
VARRTVKAFFATVSHRATDLAAIAEIAMREASTNGVEAMDALHVAAAASVGASELITTEKPSRSIHRARAVKVVTIHPEA